MMKVFDRYRAIVPDWQEFVSAVRKPLPTCVWTNRLKCDSDTLERRLAAAGLIAKRVAWNSDAFVLSSGEALGSRVEYLAGLYQVQEEIAMLPAALLAPGPGEFVLDLCAAPGNKTAQMAVMMGNTGRIIANEIQGTRMRALKQVISRLGLLNVAVTQSNAAAFAKQTMQFDRVLADVPCSAEGTSRKNSEVLSRPSQTLPSKIAAVQQAILIRALQLCRAGGRVVYSTCTYAPEENEMVVHAALAALQPKIEARIVPCTVPFLRWSPGLEKWQRTKFRPDMKNALRFYPQQNNTGGFFIAVLEKEGDQRSPGQKAWHAGEPAATARSEMRARGALLDFLEGRFGLQTALFDAFDLVQTNAKVAALQRRHVSGEVRPAPKIAGLPFVHINMKHPKITTAGAMAFGHLATRNILDLNPSQLHGFLTGQAFDLVPGQGGGGLQRGSVLVRCEDIFLGTGFFEPGATGGGLVTSQFPAAWQRSAACHAMRPSH